MEKSDHGDPFHPYARLGALAQRHFGHVTRRQLLDAGFSRAQIRSWLRRGILVRVHAGVYAVGYRRREPIALAAAAVLSGGRTAALSHGSAAALWGLRRTWPDPPEVTVVTDRRRSSVHWHRVTSLTPRETRIQLGIRTTSAARTLLDVAPDLSDRALARMVNDARIAGWVRETELLDLCERHRTRPGSSRIQAILGVGLTRSPFEDDFAELAGAYGLPAHRVNVPIAGFEADVVFDTERVVVELDGWNFHRDRAHFVGDRARDAARLEAGYVTVRLTASMLTPAERPGTARRLHAILARRRAELGLT